MKPLNEIDIRRSIVNASKGEIERMPLPGLHEVLWEEREYLGWRDHGAPLRGYLVHWVDDRAVGIVLRASGTSMRPGISAMCSFCRTPQPSDQVTLFSAARAGQSGRDGNAGHIHLCRSGLFAHHPHHAARVTDAAGSCRGHGHARSRAPHSRAELHRRHHEDGLTPRLFLFVRTVRARCAP